MNFVRAKGRCSAKYTFIKRDFYALANLFSGKQTQHLPIKNMKRPTTLIKNGFFRGGY